VFFLKKHVLFFLKKNILLCLKTTKCNPFLKIIF